MKRRQIFSRISLVLFCLLPLAVNSQSSVFAADSIKALLDNMEMGREYVRLLYHVAKNQSNPDTAIFYSNKMIQLSQEIQDFELEYYAEMAMGNAIKFKGDYSRASQSYVRAAEIASEMGFSRGLGYAKANPRLTLQKDRKSRQELSTLQGSCTNSN